MPLAPTADAIQETAASLGLAIPEPYRASVAAQYAQLLEQAARVLSVPPADPPHPPTEFEP